MFPTPAPPAKQQWDECLQRTPDFMPHTSHGTISTKPCVLTHVCILGVAPSRLRKWLHTKRKSLTTVCTYVQCRSVCATALHSYTCDTTPVQRKIWFSTQAETDKQLRSNFFKPPEEGKCHLNQECWTVLNHQRKQTDTWIKSVEQFKTTTGSKVRPE